MLCKKTFVLLLHAILLTSSLHARESEINRFSNRLQLIKSSEFNKKLQLIKVIKPHEIQQLIKERQLIKANESSQVKFAVQGPYIDQYYRWQLPLSPSGANQHNGLLNLDKDTFGSILNYLLLQDIVHLEQTSKLACSRIQNVVQANEKHKKEITELYFSTCIDDTLTLTDQAQILEYAQNPWFILHYNNAKDCYKVPKLKLNLSLFLEFILEKHFYFLINCPRVNLCLEEDRSFLTEEEIISLYKVLSRAYNYSKNPSAFLVKFRDLLQLIFPYRRFNHVLIPSIVQKGTAPELKMYRNFSDKKHCFKEIFLALQENNTSSQESNKRRAYFIQFCRLLAKSRAGITELSDEGWLEFIVPKLIKPLLDSGEKTLLGEILHALTSKRHHRYTEHVAWTRRYPEWSSAPCILDKQTCWYVGDRCWEFEGWYTSDEKLLAILTKNQTEDLRAIQRGIRSHRYKCKVNFDPFFSIRFNKPNDYGYYRLSLSMASLLIAGLFRKNKMP